MLVHEIVELDILPLKKLVVALELVKLVLYTCLLLKGILVIAIELLVVLDEQTVLILVVALHFALLSIMLVLPSSNKSLNFCMIISSESICGFNGEIWRLRKHLAIHGARGRHSGPMARLLNVRKIQVCIRVCLEDSFG